MKTPRSKRYGGDGESHKKILLVAPRHPESFWSMRGMVDMLGAKTMILIQYSHFYSFVNKDRT